MSDLNSKLSYPYKRHNSAMHRHYSALHSCHPLHLLFYLLLFMYSLDVTNATKAAPVHAFLASTPTIDGVVIPSEWEDASHFVTNVSSFYSRFAPIVPPLAGFPVDLDVNMWVKHDGVRLYFAVVVSDDSIYRSQTPAWTPASNPSANNLTKDGWPWFGDEVEFLLHMGAIVNASDSATGTPGDWQIVINAAKSRLGGIGVGGLLEGEPRSSVTAWDNYGEWIYSHAAEAATSIQLNVGANGGSTWTTEVGFNFFPFLATGPSTWWDTTQPAYTAKFNIALGDTDAEETAGPFGLRHEMWYSQDSSYVPYEQGSFADLILMPGRQEEEEFKQPAVPVITDPIPQLSFDLGSTNVDWQVINSNGSVAITAPNVVVPGMIHTDLLAAGLISEPYHQYNNDLLKWVAEEPSWTYSATFASPPGALTAPYVDLIFEGLATIATVTLNGVRVLSTNNQFRVWKAPVRELLTTVTSANNTLVVEIASSVAYAAAADAAYNMSTHNITTCPRPEEHGWCFRQFVRQNPSSFSWDFSPAFAPIGIFKRVSLFAYSDAVLRGATVTTSPVDGTAPLLPGVASAWTLNVTFWLDAPTAQTGLVRILIPALGVDTSASVALKQQLELQPVYLTVTINAAQAWWPVSYAPVGGAATLYQTTLSYTSNATSQVSSYALRIGFRTVKLMQEPLPGGTSFFFNINGIKTYMKGSNFVPIDAFESRVTLDNLTAHFDAYADAGFNIIRHWGGAVYQRDEFFNLADERGILIFMEFSFANANYPTDAPFLTNIAAEVRDQTLRLQAHPCILLWSANNEIARGLGRMHELNPTSPFFHFFIADYTLIYFDTILANLSSIDQVSLFSGGGGKRPALSSSPSQGNNTRDWPIPFEPYNSEGTGNLSGLYDGLWKGDFHGYLYAIDCWNVSEYPRTRFSTEFGLQSWPSLETMSRYAAITPTQASDYNDPFWTFRNQHPQGQDEMAFFVNQHYPAAAQSDVRGSLWMTQVSQAYCIRQQAEHYRRLTSECDVTPTGGGCNAGALYWQASDVWAGPTWSSLEYGARKKILHYYAAHFFAPFLISAFLDGDMTGGAVYVVNDDVGGTVARTGNVTVHVISFAKGLVATLPPVAYSIEPASSSRLFRFRITDLLATAGGACPTASHCFITYDDNSANSVNGKQNASGPPFLLLASIDRGLLHNPMLTIIGVNNSATTSPQTFSIQWTASAPALFIWFETPLRGVWSDNGFAFVPDPVAPPGNIKILTWTAAPDGALPTVTELAASLRIWSLFDIANGKDLTKRWPVE